MGKRSLGLLVAVFLVGLLIVACAGPSKEVQKEAGAVFVATPMVELSKTAKVVFYGTGFAPKQELQFLFKDTGGVQSIINSALTPDPVPNAEGAWVSVWGCGDYLSLIKPGTIMITITDKDYKTLAQVPVSFTAPPKKKEEKKEEKKK